MSFNKRDDVSVGQKGNVITLKFAKAGTPAKTPDPQADANFTEAELSALYKVFDRGRQEGFFEGYSVELAACDFRKFSFWNEDGEYRPSVMAMIKAPIEGKDGPVAYATKPCVGEARIFQNFDDALDDLNRRIDAIITERAINKDRAVRSQRLGQSLTPLHLA